jgi:hypothetical protein
MHTGHDDLPGIPCAATVRRRDEALELREEARVICITHVIHIPQPRTANVVTIGGQPKPTAARGVNWIRRMVGL